MDIEMTLMVLFQSQKVYLMPGEEKVLYCIFCKGNTWLILLQVLFINPQVLKQID